MKYVFLLLFLILFSFNVYSSNLTLKSDEIANLIGNAEIDSSNFNSFELAKAVKEKYSLDIANQGKFSISQSGILSTSTSKIDLSNKKDFFILIKSNGEIIVTSRNYNLNQISSSDNFIFNENIQSVININSKRFDVKGLIIKNGNFFMKKGRIDNIYIDGLGKEFSVKFQKIDRTNILSNTLVYDSDGNFLASGTLKIVPEKISATQLGIKYKKPYLSDEVFNIKDGVIIVSNQNKVERLSGVFELQKLGLIMDDKGIREKIKSDRSEDSSSMELTSNSDKIENADVVNFPQNGKSNDQSGSLIYTDKDKIPRLLSIFNDAIRGTDSKVQKAIKANTAILNENKNGFQITNEYKQNQVNEFIALLNEPIQYNGKLTTRAELVTEIAKVTKMPPELISAIWYKESEGMSPYTYLHNGDTLGRKSYNYPSPSRIYTDNEFISAGIEAIKSEDAYIKYKDKFNLNYETSNLLPMVNYANMYNGLGSHTISNPIPSDYIYSGTYVWDNLPSPGRYTFDSKFRRLQPEDVAKVRVGIVPLITEAQKKNIFRK